MPNGTPPKKVGGQGSSGTVQRHKVGYSHQLFLSYLYGVDWKPDGRYALIIGGDGLVAKYDGNKGSLLELSGVGTNQRLDSVEFQRPKGPALIVGGIWPNPSKCVGTVIEFDPNTEKFHSLTKNINKVQNYEKYWDVAWKPKTKEGLIVGEGPGVAYTFEYIIKTLNDKITREYVFHPVKLSRSDISEIDWKPPNGDYALIAGDSPAPAKFDGSTMTVIPGISDSTAASVSWEPKGDYALVGDTVGRVWKYDNKTSKLQLLPHTGVATGDIFSPSLGRIAWKQDGSCALITGDNGVILKYDPNKNNFNQIKGVSDEINLKGVAWRPGDNYALLVGGGYNLETGHFSYLAKCDGQKISKTILPPP